MRPTARRSGIGTLSAREPLLQLDLAVEAHLQAERRNLQGRIDREALGSGDAPLLDRLVDRLLDLALRADADRLQELAQADVEDFLVHGGAPVMRCTDHRSDAA